MKPETAQRMNELARMTPAERRRSLEREIFRPLLDAMLPTERLPDHLPTDLPSPKPIGGES